MFNPTFVKKYGTED